MEYTLKQLKALIDSVAGYVVIYEVKDDAFYPLVYTKNVPSFSGLSEEEYLSLYKEDAAKVVPETDLPVLTQALQKAFALKEEQETVYRTYHKTKGFVWTHVKIGAVKYVYAVYSDIDELKKQEQELEEQYNTALSFLNSVSGSYFATQRANLTKNTIEMTGGLDPLNLRAYNNYDETVQVLTDSMARESDRMQYTVKLSRASLMQAFKQGERTLPFTFMITLPSGNVRWVQHTITLAKQPGTEDIISFLAVRDISNEKFTNEVM
jgi:hypothetical protein